MKSAARPRNETTRLSALATGLRLMTTAAPKISISSAKIQNRNGDISDCELRIADCGFVGHSVAFQRYVHHSADCRAS